MNDANSIHEQVQMQEDKKQVDQDLEKMSLTKGDKKAENKERANGESLLDKLFKPKDGQSKQSSMGLAEKIAKMKENIMNVMR